MNTVHTRPKRPPDWPKQQLRGNRMAGERYTSRSFLEQEWEHLWTKVGLPLMLWFNAASDKKT